MSQVELLRYSIEQCEQTQKEMKTQKDSLKAQKAKIKEDISELVLENHELATLAQKEAEDLRRWNEVVSVLKETLHTRLEELRIIEEAVEQNVDKEDDEDKKVGPEDLQVNLDEEKREFETMLDQVKAAMSTIRSSNKSKSISFSINNNHF